MFQTSVEELSTWLCSSLADHTVTAMVEHYLLSHGEVQITDSIHGNNRNLSLVAITSDRLGWVSMLEGRIFTLWLAVVFPLLLKSGRQLLPHAWGALFISKLHNILHKQWIYRNFVIHYKG
jgi:hypothetical protein